MNGHTDESIAAEILDLFPQEIRTLSLSSSLLHVPITSSESDSIWTPVFLIATIGAEKADH